MDQSFLKTFSYDQLAAALKPTFDEFYQQLSPSQQAKITFDQVVHGAFQVLHRERQAAYLTPVPIVEKAGVSDCVMAVGMVIADAFGIIFQLLGINEAETRAATRALLEELGQETINGILATIHDFNASSSVLEKARLIWKIISEVKNAVGLSGIIKALKDALSWWDWVITGATIVAQLVAWFATDGAALIAEIALEAVYIAQFTEDVVHAVSTCDG